MGMSQCGSRWLRAGVSRNKALQDSKVAKRKQPDFLVNLGDVPRETTLPLSGCDSNEKYTLVAIKHKGEYAVSLVTKEMRDSTAHSPEWLKLKIKKISNTRWLGRRPNVSWMQCIDIALLKIKKKQNFKS